MSNIAEQFYGEFELAPWIEKSLASLDSLRNKRVLNKGTEVIEPDWWVIGPCEKDHRPHLFGFVGSGGFTHPILSINVLPPNNPLKIILDLYVYTDHFKWYRLLLNKSATRIAQQMDILLHGGYSDIVLIHVNEIINRLEL